MKKHKIIWLALVTLVLGVGSLHMLKQSNLFSDGKANLQSIKEKQLDYLKSQEEEIKKFVKSQNAKIESVEINWEETNWEELGTEHRGALEKLLIYMGDSIILRILLGMSPF